MDWFWMWWDSLTQSFRENLLAQVAGGLIVVAVCGVLAFVADKVIRRSQKTTAPALQVAQKLPPQPIQVNVNVPPLQIVQQPPALALPTPTGPVAPSIPRPPAIGFVSRRDEEGKDLVQYVCELLAKENAFVVLWGEGGVGKTALAAEIARQRDCVVWVSADGRPDFSLSTLLDAIATRFGRAEMRTLAAEAKAQAVRGLLSQPGGDGVESPLLVLDNFETIVEAEQERLGEFLASAPCAVLITTRQMLPSFLKAYSTRIDAMADAEAREFVGKLIKASPRSEVFDGLDIGEIIRVAAANPLVMEWVVAQIEQAYEPRRVFQELQRGEGDAAKRVFDRSFNLPYLGDDGRAALLASTLFVPKASREAMAEVAGLDAKRIEDAVSRLVSLKLAETTPLNERIGVAGLTRELARAHREQDGRAAEWNRQFVHYFVRYAEAHPEDTPEDLDALEPERENLLVAMGIAFAMHEWESVVRICDAQLQLLHLHGYWEQAIAGARSAAEAARHAGHPRDQARCLGNAAVILQLRGEYQGARQVHMSAIEIFKEQNDKKNAAIGLCQLGTIAQDQGDYAAAKQYYTESLEIFRGLGREIEQAASLYQLGAIALALGDYLAAKQLTDESLKIARRVPSDSGTVRALHQLGIIAQNQGDFVTAQEYYSETLKIARRLGDQTGIAATLGQLGSIAYHEGNYAVAEDRYTESLKIATRLGDQNMIAYAFHNLGATSQARGDGQTAEQYYSRSLEIEKRLGDRSGVAGTLHQLGIIAHQQGAYATAQKRYSASLDIAKRLGERGAAGRTLHQLGRIAEDQGNRIEAASLFRESLGILEQLKSPDAKVARESLERVSREWSS